MILRLLRPFSLPLLLLLLTGFALGCSSSGGSDDGGDDNLSTNACPTLGLNSRIINGTECGEQGSPIVQLNMLYVDGTVGLCSGTLISSREVLTAAHCLFGGVVRATAEVNGTSATASDIIGHPNVSVDPVTQAVFNDVAVVRFSSNLPGPALPILGSRSVDDGDVISIYGYGLDQNGNSDTLRSGEMRISDVTTSHIFAPFDGEGSNTCNGDSGGPAVFSFLNDQGVGVNAIVGVVSSGELISCEPGDTTLFTNVLSESVFNFITSTVPGVGVG